MIYGCLYLMTAKFLENIQKPPIKEDVMNKKTWFYGGLMVLFMLSSAYVVFTSASASWESEKGRCFVHSGPPLDAPWPSGCGGWPIACPDPYRTGTHGSCWWAHPWTGRNEKYTTSESGHIIKRKRRCDWAWNGCKDKGVTHTSGSLDRCYTTFC